MLQKETLRQLLVLGGLWMSSITDGFIFGQMSGMIDALQAHNSEIPLSDDDLSWISATINITCFCGFAVVGILTEIFGRKKSVTTITLPVILCWLMVYFGNDKHIILATRVIVGISYGGILLLIHISVGEYTTPNKRALCLNVISCIGSLSGTLLGHILSLLMHWRIVALIGIIPTATSAILPLFWEESPYWLASKGRFIECENAFRALHLQSELSDNEFKLLVNLEKQKQTKNKNHVEPVTSYPRKVLAACKQKYFWTILTLGFVTNIYRVAGGRVLFSTLAITMLQDITGSSDILYFTFFVDGFAVLGAIIACVLLSKLKMRPLLFTLGIISNSILLFLAAFLYFWPDNNSLTVWIRVSLLALYFITVTAGPYPILETLMTEIFPLDIKTFFFLCQATFAGIIQFLCVKLAPKMFLTIGYHGVFFLNSIVVYLCLLYLYINLPETKSKTLKEIEIVFKKNNEFIDIENKNINQNLLNDTNT